MRFTRLMIEASGGEKWVPPPLITSAVCAAFEKGKGKGKGKGRGRKGKEWVKNVSMPELWSIHSYVLSAVLCVTTLLVTSRMTTQHHHLPI